MAGPPYKIAVVLPTRNRADLAIAGCNALLEQQEPAVHVYVSDNSTSAEHVAQLADFSRRCDRTRLSYLRPPEPLAMGAHWDWALSGLLDSSDATHYVLQYDRRIMKPHHLLYVTELMRRFPDTVVTWPFDQIQIDGEKRFVTQYCWDGRCYAIRTARVAELTSAGRVVQMGFSFPFLSNCLVPRDVLVAIRRRFGDVCHSTGPDSCFTYRLCTVRDRYIHFDRTLAVAYAMERSAGWGYFTGGGGDFKDFSQSLGTESWLHAAPIPGLSLGQNMAYHEYELVRRATGHPAFKPIDPRGYLEDLGLCLHLIGDSERAAELRAILIQYAYASGESTAGLRVRDGWPWVRRLIRDLFLETALRVKVSVFKLRRLLATKPRMFDDDLEALQYAFHTPRRRTDRNPQMAIFQPTEVAGPLVSDEAPSATSDRLAVRCGAADGHG